MYKYDDLPRVNINNGVARIAIIPLPLPVAVAIAVAGAGAAHRRVTSSSLNTKSVV
jgi:hypothetical protein